MKTVMIMEGNEEIRENMRELLELFGFRVVCASSGVTGVDVAEQQRPDVIIGDLSSAFVSDLGVLRRLRANQSTASIPFIYLASRMEREEVSEAMATGADACVRMPFEIDELIDVMDRVCR